MTIVPKQPDLIDRLIELENRNAATEKGCGDGGSTTPDPTTDSSTPQTVTRDVIVNLEGATRSSGAKVFPDGTFPRIGPSHIIGTGVDPETYKAQQVRFDGKHRWWRRSASAKGSGVAPGQRIFALPPGWWPPADQVRDVPCGKGKTCTITVESATGIVRYTSGPSFPQAIDLAQFGAFPGGGGACPGNDPDDPTGAFDGRQWDCCQAPGEDDLNDPIIDPTLPPGGGPGGGGGIKWIDIPIRAGAVAMAGHEPQVGISADGYLYHLRGAVMVRADSAPSESRWGGPVDEIELAAGRSVFAYGYAWTFAPAVDPYSPMLPVGVYIAPDKTFRAYVLNWGGSGAGLNGKVLPLEHITFARSRAVAP